MPMNAKITMPEVPSSDEACGASGQARLPGVIYATPIRTNPIKGTSLAAVISSTTRTPDRTPRTLKKTAIVDTAITITACASGVEGTLASASAEPANSVVTTATPDKADTTSRTPESSPTKGPNAASM
jgi:hypothetical protein